MQLDNIQHQQSHTNNKSQIAIFDLGNVVLNWHVPTVLSSLPYSTAIKDQLNSELFNHSDWFAMDHGLLTENTAIENICQRSDLTREQVSQALQAAKDSLIEIEQTIALMSTLVANAVPLYCLSNMSVETYQHVKHFDFFNWFEGVLISGVEKTMKPDAQVFQRLIQRFQLTPQDCLFIDDSLANIEAARAQGLKVWHFLRTEKCYREIEKALLK